MECVKLTCSLFYLYFHFGLSTICHRNCNLINLIHLHTHTHNRACQLSTVQNAPVGGCLCLCLSLLPLSLSLYHAAHTKNNQKHFLLQFDTQSSCLHTHTQAETDRLYITHCVAIDTFVSMYVSHELSMHTHTSTSLCTSGREKE